MSIDFGNDIYEEPLVTTSFLQEDTGEVSLRPKTLKEYIGQEKAKENLSVFIAAARKRERDRKAQEAALAALEDREHVRRTVENNKEGMRFYEQAFREMGLEWIPSQGNFILVKVGRGKQVFQDMLARGVIVRAQDGYGLPEWIRISVGTPAENARCIEVLKEVL